MRSPANQVVNVTSLTQDGNVAGAPVEAKATSPVPDASDGARRLAAAILEVLAGVQTPSDAASGLGISLARYYQLELRAIAGMVSACENRRRGRGRAAGSDLASLRRECEQLRRECARQQALARTTRKTVGLVANPLPPKPTDKPKRRKRRPTARALKMAGLLQAERESADALPDQPAAQNATVENPSGGI